MLIHIGYDLIFEFTSPTAMTLLLYVHPNRAGDLVEPEKLDRRAGDSASGFHRMSLATAPRGVVAPVGQIRLHSESTHSR